MFLVMNKYIKMFNNNALSEFLCSTIFGTISDDICFFDGSLDCGSCKISFSNLNEIDFRIVNVLLLELTCVCMCVGSARRARLEICYNSRNLIFCKLARQKGLS